MGERFGQALRQWRKAAGLSQPQLARQVLLSQSNVSRLENGKLNPDETVAERLDEVLGTQGQLRVLATGDVSAEVLTWEDGARIARAGQRPHALDAGTVSALANVLAAQRRLDDSLGPHPLIPRTHEQLTLVTRLVRQGSGRHRKALADVAAEWVQFAGWLHAEARDDRHAERLLAEAARAAEEIGNPVLAAQASNFRGYLARQQGRPLGIVRGFLGEHHTPGANIHQQLGAAAQAAHGYAALGEHSAARRLLETAEGMLDEAAGVPAPATAYWLNVTYHRLNLGLAYLGLGEHSLAAGLDGLPADQQDALWAQEYRTALGQAQDRAR